jgi:uncharacterized protein with PIN domain
MRFVCDGSLGGLARWLRAAGYEAAWREGLTGEALLREARGTAAVVLTSDHEVFLRREVVSGRLPALPVSSRLSLSDQLRHVLRTLALPLGRPRCMACGGVLEVVPKEAVRERIPPRTARWKDEYFVCRGCGRLLWQGTHWERIAARLRAAAAP